VRVCHPEFGAGHLSIFLGHLDHRVAHVHTDDGASGSDPPGQVPDVLPGAAADLEQSLTSHRFKQVQHCGLQLRRLSADQLQVGGEVQRLYLLIHITETSKNSLSCVGHRRIVAPMNR
jgi:hypothetical protein